MSHVQPKSPPKNHPRDILCKEIMKYIIKNGKTFRQLDIKFFKKLKIGLIYC